MNNRIISIDITPDNDMTFEGNGGVMWEHNATVLKFNIAADFIGDYRYYIEYRSLMGTKVRTDYLELDAETQTVSYSVPVSMSSLKGVECHFNIVRIDADGITQQVIKSKKFCLTFDFSPDTDNTLCKVNDFSINALLEAIRNGTFKGDKGDRGEKGDKGDKGDTGGISEEYAALLFANACKGVKSGESISIDDFSPLEHEISVSVHGRNYLDLSKLSTNSSETEAYISHKDENCLVVTTPSGYTGNGMVNTKLFLKDVCPELKAGTICFLSAETESPEMKCMYLYNFSGSIRWNFNTSKKITDELLNSIFIVYGFNNAASLASPEGTGDCRISNMQIEDGVSKNEYMPYISPSSVTVKIGEENYIPAEDGTISGIMSAENMTASSDTEGAIIRAEYNRDLNKVIEKIENAIVSLGGNI